MQLPTDGTQTLLVTPFDRDGGFDRGSMAGLIDFVLEGGAAGVVALGTTGEFFTLTPRERIEVAEFVVRHVRGRAPVTVGVGAPDTATAVGLAAAAESAGADCVMALPPFYFELSAEAQVAHFIAVARSVRLPVMLYDGAAGIPVPVEVIARVAGDALNLRYVKLALPDPNRVTALAARLPDLVPLAGDDTTLVAALRNGAQGSAIATGNIQPGDVAAVHAAHASGDEAEAVRIFAATLAPSIMATSTPKRQFIVRFKEVLTALGLLAAPTVRLPLLPLAAPDREELLNVMRGLKVL